jgi:hypothetical protein
MYTCNYVRLLAVAAVLCLLIPLNDRGDAAGGSNPKSPQQMLGSAPRDDAAAAAAFEAMVKVLHHPRCMNCHSKGDYPRQGDDNRHHTMHVRRGHDGDGIAGVKCSTCHQDHNLDGVDTPPGAPDWHLPSPQMPMIWEGLSDRQLCELFKDPAQNGGRTVGQIVEHMQTPLVRWGWHPGDGRTPIPVPQTTFLAEVKEWASRGAACPSDNGAPHASD